VDQSGAMQKLDDGGETDGAAIFATGIICGKEQERGAHALPSPTEQICCDFGDGRERGTTLARELLFDENKIVADEIKDFLGGQKRDGASPKLALFPVT
jgi:hypothetical protein